MEQVLVTEYHDRVNRLLDHLAEILSDDEFEKINVKIWNKVSLAEPEIVYSE